MNKKKPSPQKIVTAFTEDFGIKYPIVSAPMFLVSNVDMVVASSEAGGLGTFPALNFRPIEKYHEAICEIKSKTKKPFGINIIVQESNKYYKEQLDIALRENVALIITSLGNPKDLIKKAHKVGTKVYCDVVGLRHAKKVAGLGADGVIAVGSGAGGHAGDISPFALIPHLVDHLRIPVLAAGSIVDGRGMAAAFSLGASAAYMGTRFIASKECAASHDYKDAILKAKPEDIVNTHRVDGFPGNFIKTPALEKLGLENSFLEDLISKNNKAKKWLAFSRAAKSLFGDPKGKASYQTVFSAGHGAGLIEKVESIQEIIFDTVKSYHNTLKALP